MTFWISWVLACAPSPEPVEDVRPPPPARPTADPRAVTGSWSHAMQQLQADLDRAEELAAKHANDWGRLAEVASLYLERARWSGDYDDYARAEEALDRAFAKAPAGSGPILLRAKLNFTVHRLDRVDADLDRQEQRHLDDPQRAELLRLRADLALERGRPADAEAMFRESLALHRSMSARYGLVQVAWQRAAFDEALAGLDECEALVPGVAPTTRMWLDLQRGLVELDRGRHEQALAHYHAAEAHVSGHWLVREHVAEVTALLGRTDEAVALYEAILADRPDPEFASALASLLRDRGDAAGAARLAAQADEAFAVRLARYPEATAGHALEHALEHGTDVAATVALAERNAAVRPNGAALTRLAAAYRAAGRLDEARQALARATATTWESAELHAEGARLAEAAGDPAAAARARERARQLDPTSD